jgi:predicted nucleic acid-binding protein
MKYILDSSVAFKWELSEIDSDKADALREDFRNAIHELLAPDIFTVEVSHALTRAERQGRIAVGEARKLFLDILTTPPRFCPFQPLLLRAIDISSKMRVGVYDCLYVALAEQEGCELVTADDKLINALQKDFPFIIALASIP